MTMTRSSIFTFLNAYCSPFPVFSEGHRLAVLGARSLPSLLAALIIRDRAPMVQRTLLNLLRLLLLLLLFFFSKLNRILEGLNMLEKSGNFAHASELVKNLRLIWVSGLGVANGSTSATLNIQRSAPRATFTYMYENWYTHVT